ncbi:MAG: hypothetical protein ASARMPRED_003176 [Alectoria sarmentosa]|nr:MAG: hypothetical protein ASARMPRED_003176 [Alectoria sarmentosa]
MSLPTDMALLTEKYGRLEAQLEVQEQKSRIKELEQKVNNLEADKRLSAQNSDVQALQLAMPTSSLDTALRAEIAQLQRQIAARDVTIAKLDTKVSRLFEVLAELPTGLRELASKLESKIEQGVAGALDTGRELTAQTADEEHEPQKDPTSSLSITDTEKPDSRPASPPKSFYGDMSPTPLQGSTKPNPPTISAFTSTLPPQSDNVVQRPHMEHGSRSELAPNVSIAETNKSDQPFPASQPKAYQGDVRSRPNTPSGSTPAKLPADSSSEPTASSQLNYAQALQAPRNKQKEQISQRSNSSFGPGRPRGRGGYGGIQLRRSVRPGEPERLGGSAGCGGSDNSRGRKDEDWGKPEKVADYFGTGSTSRSTDQASASVGKSVSSKNIGQMQDTKAWGKR